MRLPILLLVGAVVAEVNIFANSIDNASRIKVGSIVTADANGFEFQQENSLPANTDYCIGTSDLPNHECFGYIRTLVEDEKLKLLVKADSTGGIIKKLLINPDIQAQQPLVVVAEVGGPSPIMNPVHSQKKNSKPAKSRIAPDGGEVVAEEEEEEEVEDDRSFVQKNWMYIVPGLLLLFMGLSPAEEK